MLSRRDILNINPDYSVNIQLVTKLSGANYYVSFMSIVSVGSGIKII